MSVSPVTVSAHTSTREPSASVTIQREGGPATSSMKTDLSGEPRQPWHEHCLTRHQARSNPEHAIVPTERYDTQPGPECLHPRLPFGEHDQGVEDVEAVFGGGGQVAADGAELAG